jgi:hypothetical protein
MFRLIKLTLLTILLFFFTANNASALQFRTVSVTELVVYDGPDGQLIGILDKGQRVAVNAKAGDWVRIIFPSEDVVGDGWVLKKYLSDK